MKGACTGGSCGVADSCEVDADCTCGATDCRPNASGSVSDTRILANDIEGPATAGTNIINVGKVTVIGDNYMETQTSGGQINIDEDGGDTLIRGNRIQLSTTGGNVPGGSLRKSAIARFEIVLKSASALVPA